MIRVYKQKKGRKKGTEGFDSAGFLLELPFFSSSVN